MKYDFNDIESAFHFVSSSSPEMNCAVLDRQTGKIYYMGDAVDEEEEKVPADVDDTKRYLAIPHKNDLELGRRLVFRFVYQNMPDDFDMVQGFFSHKGAYSNYKDWLSKTGKLEEWYKYENDATDKALKEWCNENNLEI